MNDKAFPQYNLAGGWFGNGRHSPSPGQLNTRRQFMNATFYAIGKSMEAAVTLFGGQ